MTQSMKGSRSLLSPPSSPRMSAYSVNSADHSWHDSHLNKQRTGPAQVSFGGFPTIAEESSVSKIESQASGSNDRPPLLRSHKSFPYNMGAQFVRRSSPLGKLAIPENGGTSAVDVPETSQSAPVSPSTQLTPKSAIAEPEDLHDELEAVEEIDMIAGEGEDEETPADEGTTKTAAERRAEKRKMKRFRLTHNQTRFLMSEFTRQAHPDAAHRERLSREIPGLSPRQVQVWFQNRRAKLKRLTSDDRERMLKSRALPDDFDMTQALHSPYGGQPTLGTPVASPVTYFPSYHENAMVRPMMADGIRRQSDDDSTTSPMSMTSAYNNFFTPPGSSTTSEAMSPISTTSDRSHFNPLPNSMATSPRGTSQFARSSSFSAYSHPHIQIPRLQIHDRVNRTRAESLASPLRTSMSYTGNPMEYPPGSMPPPYDPRRASEQRGPGGIEQANTYGSQNTQMQAPPTSSMGRMRSLYSAVPSLQLRQDYRSPTSNAHPTSYGSLQSAPLAAPSDFSNYPQVSAPYQTPGYSMAYAHPNASTTSLPGQISSYEHSQQVHTPAASPNQPMHQPYDPSRGRSFTNPFDYNSSNPRSS